MQPKRPGKPVSKSKFFANQNVKKPKISLIKELNMR